MLKKSLIALLLCAPAAAQPAQEPDHAIHEELRGLLKTVQGAVSSGKYEDMVPALSDDVRVTTTLQEFVGHGKDVPLNLRSHFGEGKKVKTLTLSLEPDVLTELSPDKTWGLCYGKGTEDYVLNDGRTYHFLTRWTSTVAKDADGKWRIRSMHMGANFMDNPILTETVHKSEQYAIFAAVGAGLVGLVLGYLAGRRRSA